MQGPSFDNTLAMELLEKELGAPWPTFYSELTPEPIAAASLGQVRPYPAQHPHVTLPVTHHTTGATPLGSCTSSCR